MLQFFQSVATRGATESDVDKLLTMEGTKLVIAQQNISRTVSTAQYRELLTALAAGRDPDISPVRDDDRSRNGVKGLLKDDWPALQWAVQHTNVLASRLQLIQSMNVNKNAQELAEANLPQKVPVSTKLYVVMGGRAGAATLDDGIYFDLLASSFRESRDGAKFPNGNEVIEFFAHEMHHYGLAQIIDRRAAKMALSDSQKLGFNLLRSIVMEGSATYLINEHRSLASMPNDPVYRDSFREQKQLFTRMEELLRQAIAGTLTRDAYEHGLGPFLGSGYHVAGAVILATIDRAEGKPAVLVVMQDPCRILHEYNAAAAKLGKSAPSDYRFGRDLASSVEKMGAKTK